ncbi:hypothetical protein PGB90_010377 [Kerria lacca]
MVDKLHEYQGPLGQLHTIRDNLKSNFTTWKENNTDIKKNITDKFLKRNSIPPTKDDIEDFNFNHIFRKKTQWELLRLCAIVAGIEFSYSAITAFSSPILLEIGVKQSYMSLVFSISPAFGFFLTPICGSLSDHCESRFGRRRVFIVIFSSLELLGLFLIPYGQSLSQKSQNKFLQYNSTTNHTNLTDFKSVGTAQPYQSHTSVWIIILTVFGIVIADHFADALQNPSRAYLLDVCQEDDHTRGLSMFTVLAGCGGTIGYGFGAIDWDNSFMGYFFGSHITTVFILTSILFIFCVVLTITTFKEVPLKYLHKIQRISKKVEISEDHVEREIEIKIDNNLSNKTNKKELKRLNESLEKQLSQSEIEIPSLKEYLSSIVNQPFSMKILLLTNILCWMSHVSYSLYFTDYVGEAIFNGDPKAPLYSKERKIYEEGIRFACIGMSIYSSSCMICSLFMERAIKKFGLSKVYKINLCIHSVSMAFMYYFNSKESALLFSFASGVLYCTLFTVPYVLVARYHTLNVFEIDGNGEYVHSKQVRGLGTDIAIMGSSVFFAQFFLSLGMGTLVSWYGSTTAVPLICSILSFCALIVSTKVIYAGL